MQPPKAQPHCLTGCGCSARLGVRCCCAGGQSCLHSIAQLPHLLLAALRQDCREALQHPLCRLMRRAIWQQGIQHSCLQLRPRRCLADAAGQLQQGQQAGGRAPLACQAQHNLSDCLHKRGGEAWLSP